MNNGFRKGVIFGSILGASMGAYFVNRMSPFQKRRAIKNTRKAMENIKNGIGRLW